jgi:hypothetical protein
MTLSEWLEIATAKLTAPAKQRISAEIEAHIGDAVENHIAKGLPEADAQATALAELGSATSAATRFRRRHLTEGEAKRVEQTLKYSGSLLWLVLLYAAFPFICAFFLRAAERHHAPSIFPSITALIFVVLPTIEFLAARRKNRQSAIRLILSLQMLQTVNFIMFWLWWGIWIDWGLFVAMVVGNSFGLIRDYWLWFKLRRIADAWPDMPPRDAAAS